jgi:WD40 repeat protein/serine/threonine protein kinase
MPETPQRGPALDQQTPAQQLADQWRQGQRPDVHAFLAHLPDLGAEERLAVLRIDQRQRWQQGERIRVEAYLAQQPTLAGDDERILDLIYSEVVLREALGECPHLEEYVERFPHYAEALQRQFALDRAMNWDSILRPEPAASGPSSAGPAGDAETLRLTAAAPGEPGVTPVLEPPPVRTPSRVTVPGYHILGELGRGGMGVVYRAEQVRPKRVVALKMILAGDHAGAQELARFRREAEAVAQLEHPNVVHIYEVGECAGLPYFSLEYVSGGSLAANLRGTPLPPRTAAEFVKTLARAMHYAHERGIVHRDLKPANVLLQPIATKNTESHKNKEAEPNAGSENSFSCDFLCFSWPFLPKITDFGLAKRLDTASLPTHSGQILGTPSYMAPEQARGQTNAVGPAADVYALGAILYELLTGRPPFRAATAVDTIVQVMAGDPVPPRRLQPQVPRDLETICLKCLEKEAGKRYASASDLADDLGRFLGQRAILARPIGPWGRLVKGVWRRPALAALGVVLVLGTVLAFSGVLWHLHQTQQEQQQTQSALDQAEGNLYLNHIALAARELTAHNVDRAEQLLDQCPFRLRNWEWHHLKRLCHLERHTWPGVGGFGVAFSPDGRFLASASVHDQTVRVLDAHTGTVLHTFRKAGPAVAFSPDGQRLASATFTLGALGEVPPTEHSMVKVWDPSTGREVLTLGGTTGHQSIIWAVAFSPDGLRLASGSWDRTVKIWDAKTGILQRTLVHPDRVESVAFGRGDWLASATASGKVQVWNTATGFSLLSIGNPSGSGDRGGTGFRASLGEKGETFLKGEATPPRTWDTARKVWDATCSTEVLTLRGETHQVASVALSADGKRLAFTSGDTIRFLEVTPDKIQGRSPAELAERVITLRGHSDLVRSIAFSPDGTRLGSASYDKSVKVWDIPTGKELFTLVGHTEPVNSVAFSPDGKQLASAAWDRAVKIWDATAGREVRTIAAHEKLVRSVAYSPDGRLVASGSADHSIKLWDAAGATAPRTLAGHTDLVRSVAFSSDSKRLVSASYDKTVKVWDVATGRLLRTFAGHKERVFAAVFRPDGKWIASAGLEGVVKVWEADTGREIRSFRGHKGRIHALAFSPDGRLIASAGDDRIVRIWEADTGREVLTMAGHTRDIMTVVFSPRGRRLASAGLDRTIRLWDLDTGREIATLEGHTEAVLGLAFRPDGTRLASGSMDRTIKLWDPASGQEALTLRGTMMEVFSLAFSPDGQRIASGNADGAVRIWDGSPRGE